jgi:hypothetical protein
VVLCFGAWESEGFLDADYIHVLRKGYVEGGDVAWCAFACVSPADLKVSVSRLFVAAVALMLCLVSYHRGTVVLMSIPSLRRLVVSLPWLKLSAERSARLRFLLNAVDRLGRPFALSWELGVLLLAVELAFS